MFKRIKFLLTFFLLFLCVFGLVSCEKEEIPAPKAEALLAHYSGKTVRPWIELDEEDDCFPPAEVPYFITYNYDNSSPGVTTFILQVNENHLACIVLQFLYFGKQPTFVNCIRRCYFFLQRLKTKLRVLLILLKNTNSCNNIMF